MKDYKNKKEFKKALADMDAVEVYQEVLRGKYIESFPRGFWKRSDASENAKKITRYLIEDRLKWNENDIKKNININIFKSNSLTGMISKYFNASPFKAIDNAYPGRFKPWELKSVSKNYWNKDTAKEATIWMVEEKLKWNDKDIKEKLSARIFYSNGLGGLLAVMFNYSPFKAIDNAYPGKFKKEDFKNYK